MKDYSAIIQNGELKMQSEYMRESFKKFLKNHEGSRIEFVPVLPESKKQRGFYHSAVLPLWAYLDHKEYRDNDVIEALHEIAKLEFNGDFMVVNGKTKRYGKSTKQQLHAGYLQRIMDYLAENYGIDQSKVLDPKAYKKWRDEVYPSGGPDNYIDYMVSIGLLKAN